MIWSMDPSDIQPKEPLCESRNLRQEKYFPRNFFTLGILKYSQTRSLIIGSSGCFQNRARFLICHFLSPGAANSYRRYFATFSFFKTLHKAHISLWTVYSYSDFKSKIQTQKFRLTRLRITQSFLQLRPRERVCAFLNHSKANFSLSLRPIPKRDIHTAGQIGKSSAFLVFFGIFSKENLYGFLSASTWFANYLVYDRRSMRHLSESERVWLLVSGRCPNRLWWRWLG